jgi:hypothetical protein
MDDESRRPIRMGCNSKGDTRYTLRAVCQRIIIIILLIVMFDYKKFPKLHIRPPSLILLMIHPRIGEYFPAKAEK